MIYDASFLIETKSKWWIFLMKNVFHTKHIKMVIFSEYQKQDFER